MDGRHQSKSSRPPKALDDNPKEHLELSKDRDITLKSSIDLKKAIGKQQNHIKKLENTVEEKDKPTQILSQEAVEELRYAKQTFSEKSARLAEENKALIAMDFL
jgi:hypothetical protein